MAYRSGMTVHDPKLQKRLVVLIDAENVSFSAAERFLKSMNTGIVSDAIAVADWSSPSLAPYASAPAGLGLRFVHCFGKAAGNGRKSRSDFAICGEAVAMLQTRAPDEILILSSDQDFDAFIASCGHTQRLRRVAPPSVASGTDQKREAALKPLLAALRQNPDGLSLNVLGKSLKAKEFGFASLSRLATHFPAHCTLRDGKVYREVTA